MVHLKKAGCPKMDQPAVFFETETKHDQTEKQQADIRRNMRPYPVGCHDGRVGMRKKGGARRREDHP